MEQLRWDNQVVVVTGAGSGLGREYAKFFASRGAKVVVNDLGGSISGAGNSSKAADAVVQEIKTAGGTAVANYDSVEEGEKIVQTAIKSFGRIDVLVNNAGILRDITMKNMKDDDFDKIIAVHLTGAYRCTKAAWPHFRKQKYGRIINTSSTSGLYGNFGQSNYAAAKMALVGFTETLAKEGLEYNILANALAPGAASRLTATVFDPRMMEIMKPDWVVPIVGVLCHSSNTKETGGIFSAAAGHFDKVRWERSKGLLLKPNDSLTPGALLAQWETIGDFTDAVHPKGVSDSMGLLKQALNLPDSYTGQEINLAGKVALITGGGDGLGRAYCRLFGRLGAKVAVCDVGNADEAVDEVRKAGGEAFAIKMSVEKGDEVVKAVLDRYGRIDLIVNNAGILRDKAFTNMTDELWFPVISVHLRGTYKIIKAAWPHMIRQKYGRIVNVSSTSGIYGSFGQANYASAKCGIVGLSWSLAREGAKYNILVNVLAPSAGTNMTRTVRPEAEVQAMKPDYVAPLVAVLCSDQCPTPAGKVYEVGCGWHAETRWQRTRGVDYEYDDGVPSVETVRRDFERICDFEVAGADHPSSPADGSKYSGGIIARSKKLNAKL